MNFVQLLYQLNQILGFPLYKFDQFQQKITSIALTARLIMETHTYNTHLEKIIEIINNNPSIYLLGIAGIPGAGKTTFSSFLMKKISNSIVLPMDGYHIYRCNLDEKGIKFRGAPYTFNYQRFKEDLCKLKQNHYGSFPNFDHAVKDPSEDAIIINTEHKIVIVEGLYLFLEEWNINDLFDLRIFMDCSIEIAIERLAKRHLECGIVNNLEEGIERANFNDKVNAEYLLKNSKLDETVIYIKTQFQKVYGFMLFKHIHIAFSFLSGIFSFKLSLNYFIFILSSRLIF